MSSMTLKRETEKEEMEEEEAGEEDSNKKKTRIWRITGDTEPKLIQDSLRSKRINIRKEVEQEVVVGVELLELMLISLSQIITSLGSMVMMGVMITLREVVLGEEPEAVAEVDTRKTPSLIRRTSRSSPIPVVGLAEAEVVEGAMLPRQRTKAMALVISLE